jgi:hypothetical protein
MVINKKNLLLVILNSIAVIATIVVNTIAVVLPLNGKETGQLSDNIPNLFVPSGITFSIWSIIYIFLIIFMLYQVLDIIKKAKQDNGYIGKIGFWFISASIANIVWIFLWHYEYVTLSLFAMLLLFASLLLIYQRLEIGLTNTIIKEKIAVHITISIYLGWITVATIANVTAVLVKLDVGGLFLGEASWAILVTAVATIITILIILRRGDYAFSLVIIWALIGIVIKRLSDDEMYGIQTNIAITATVAIILVTFVIIFKIIKTGAEERLST